MTTATSTPDAAADPYIYSIFQTIDDAHRNMHGSKATMLKHIRLMDEMHLAPLAGARTTAQWLMRRFGIASSTAHEYVHIAHNLGRFAHLEHYFALGNISYSVVRLLLRYLTEDNEEELVELACDIGYHALEAHLTAHTPTTGGDTDTPEYYLRLHHTDTGDLRFHGCLNPADAEAFKTALKLGEIAYHDLDELFDTPPDGTPATDDDITTATTNAHTIEPAKPARQTASGYGLPIGRTLVKALMGIVHIARTIRTNTLITPAAHVNIVATTDGRAYMPNNLGAHAEAITHILANANLRLNTVDDTGLIINTGRQFRLANPAQINALMLMWGHQCAAPGCTHTRFIEIHHINNWATGGHTDLANLIPLCSACHSLVSEGYIRTEKDGTDIHFIYQDGTRYVSENYSTPRRRDNAITLNEYNQLTEEEPAG